MDNKTKAELQVQLQAHIHALELTIDNIADLKEQLKLAKSTNDLQGLNMTKLMISGNEKSAHIQQCHEFMSNPDKPAPKKWRILCQSLIRFAPRISLAKHDAEVIEEARNKIFFKSSESYAALTYQFSLILVFVYYKALNHNRLYQQQLHRHHRIFLLVLIVSLFTFL